MSFETRRAIIVFFILALVLFYGVAKTGLVGPDEPRYAAIGREMARSGDFVTPVLWGSPWFEKPPLVYWTTAIATRLGLDPDRAPRLPIGLMAFAFLVFFYWFVNEEFGPAEALYSSAILGSSAMWLAYSLVAVTDIPLSTCACAAALLALRLGLGKGGWRTAAVCGILLGLAALAKGLVPFVLFAPALILLRRRLKLLLVIAAACLVVAAPWYTLITIRHGSAFTNEFFLKHHFSRFSSDALRHVQPFWFYIPVLFGGLFPWIPMLAVVRTRFFNDERLKATALWAVWVLLFFSASRNKLPGYVLPIMPALAMILGVSLAWSRQTRAPLALTSLLIGGIPMIAGVLPQALAVGLTHSSLPSVDWPWFLAALFAAGVCLLLEFQQRRSDALLLVAAILGITLLSVKLKTFPVLDRTVSARYFFDRHGHWLEGSCLQDVNRDLAYGLQYYSGHALPQCADPKQTPKILGIGNRLVLLN